MEADSKEITKIYRKKSLLIHPDKVKHGEFTENRAVVLPSLTYSITARAIEAFDMLKKASTLLLDEEKRKKLDETVMEARVLVLRELSLPADTPGDDERIRGLRPPFEEMVRKKTKEVMVDDELRRRK